MSTLPLESLIKEAYAGPELPPLWQVIYHEAIRGHHLLFHPLDVARFEQERYVPGEDLSTLYMKLETVCIRLMECSDLAAMTKIIDNLHSDDRRRLYDLYQRAIKVWNIHVKSSLH